MSEQYTVVGIYTDLVKIVHRSVFFAMLLLVNLSSYLTVAKLVSVQE
jgi:hypothetical protein